MPITFKQLPSPCGIVNWSLHRSFVKWITLRLLSECRCCKRCIGLLPCGVRGDISFNPRLITCRLQGKSLFRGDVKRFKIGFFQAEAGAGAPAPPPGRTGAPRAFGQWVQNGKSKILMFQFFTAPGDIGCTETAWRLSCTTPRPAAFAPFVKGTCPRTCDAVGCWLRLVLERRVRVDSLQYPLWDVWRLEGCVLYWTSL